MRHDVCDLLRESLGRIATTKVGIWLDDGSVSAGVDQTEYRKHKCKIATRSVSQGCS